MESNGASSIQLVSPSLTTEPTEIQQITGNDPNDTTRKRVRVACDNCRTHKIRCSGTYPCRHCVDSKKSKECHYTKKPSKKQKPSNDAGAQTTKKTERAKSSNVGAIVNGTTVPDNFTDKRLTKLEGLMNKLQSTVEMLVESSMSVKAVKENPLVSQIPLSSQVPLVINQGAKSRNVNNNVNNNNGNNNNGNNNNGNNNNGNNNSLQPELRNKSVEPNSVANTSLGDSKAKNVEHFVGTQSIWCMFSKESLDWMEQTLGPDGKQYVRPIRNLPLLFHSKCALFVQKWVDPPLVDKTERKTLLESPFPLDPKFVFDLIDSHYKELSFVNIIMDSNRVKEMFEAYYKKSRSFKLSELLIMTSSLLIALLIKMEKRQHSPLENLPKLQEKWLNNSIFYYQRLCVVNDGIETVEGILSLLVYLESNWVTGHFNYIPLSVAIRYAQELGLHRSESLYHLSPKEQERRRLLWWFCQFFDTEMCFKTGKPPAINVEDVSTNDEMDMLRLCLDTSSDTSSTCKRNGENGEGENKDNRENNRNDESGENDGNGEKVRCVFAASEILFGDESVPLRYRLLHKIKEFADGPRYHCFFSMLLTRIRAKSYQLLFSASAQTRDFESLSKTLDDLNNEIFELAMWSPEEERPRFFNDPQFRLLTPGVPANKRQFLISNLLIFFSQLMIINRVPFIVRSEYVNYDSKIVEYRNLSLDSARTMLVLVLQIDGAYTPSFFNWILFYAVSAFLILGASILNHPHSAEAGTDVNLLIDAAKGFFSITHDDSILLIGRSDISVSLVIQLMLNVIIKLYQDKTKQQVSYDHPSMLKTLRERFPEIFQDVQHVIKNIVGASPFNNTEAIALSRHSSSAVSSVNSLSRKNSPYALSPRYNPSVSNLTDSVDNTPGGHINVHNTGLSPEYAMRNGNAYPQGGVYGLGLSSNPQVHTPHEHYNTSYVRTGQTPMRTPGGGNIGIGGGAGAGAGAGTGGGVELDGYDLFAQTGNDGVVTNILMNQMNNMPNFFFDNNMGI